MTKIIRSDRTFLIVLALAAILAIWQALVGENLAHALLPLGLPVMFGVVDAELIIRDQGSDGNLTVDETSDAFDIGPFPLNGVPFRLTIPNNGGALDTLAVYLKSCDTVGGTYVEDSRYSTDETGAGTTAVVKGVYRKRLYAKRRFVKVTFDITNNSGSLNLGAVDLRAEAAGEYTNADRAL